LTVSITRPWLFNKCNQKRNLMAKVLSQEEIDALLTSIPTGGEADQESESKQQKITLYDFKHPNLISKEQMRLLENIHEGMVRNLGVFLSAQLRMIVDISLMTIDQIMYSEYVMSISSPAATYVGTISDPHSQFVLDLSPQLVVFIVERLFGGQGSFGQINRSISIIERKIMKRVVNRIAVEISKNWNSLKEFDCDFVRFESNPEFVQIVPASEPVIVVSMEVKIRGVSSLLNFCYPYIWVSSIISTPEVQDRILFGAKQTSTDEINAVSDSLSSTKVCVKSLLGSNWLRVSEIINLKIGDVIPLNTRISRSIPIYIQNKYTYNGTVGNRNRNYAVRIESIAKGDKHDPN